MVPIRILVALALVVVAVSAIDWTTYNEFILYDCRIPGCGEAGGVCNHETGRCDCSGATMNPDGFDCSYDASTTCSAAAQPSCPTEGATCAQDSTAQDVCVCDDGTWLDDSTDPPTCQPNIVLNCDTPGKHIIEFHLEKGTTFTGKVRFVNDDTGDTVSLSNTCELAATVVDNVVSLTIDSNNGPNSGACSNGMAADGTTTLTFTDYDSIGDYVRLLYLQREAEFEGIQDIMAYLVCSPSADGKTIVKTVSAVSNVVTSSISGIGLQYVFGGGSKLEIFEYFKAGGAAITTTPLDVGTVIDFELYKITPETSHAHWYIETAILSNRLVVDANGDPIPPPGITLLDYTNGGFEAIEIITAGCSTPMATAYIFLEDFVVTQADTHTADNRGASSLKGKFLLIRLPGEDSMVIDFRIKACTEGSSLCDITCAAGYKAWSSDGTTARRRKRRAVTDTGDGKIPESFNVPSNLTINIRTPESTSTDHRQGGAGIGVDFGSCVQSIVFIVPLILLVILVIVAMALAVYFFSKLNSRRSKDEEVHMTYK